MVAFSGNLFTYPYRNKKSGWINRIFVTYNYKHSLKKTAIGQIGSGKITANRIAKIQRNDSGYSLLLINELVNPDGRAT